jgi:Zn-dependent protease with chaperone function
MVDAATDDATVSTAFPDVKPAIAARYTALQLACAAVWSQKYILEDSVAVLRRAQLAVKWPPHLLARLQGVVEGKERPVALDHNPRLMPGQVILLFCLTLLSTRNRELAEQFGRMHGLGEAAQNYLAQSLEQALPHNPKQDPALMFFEPPEEIVAFVEKMTRRLGAGAEALKPVGHHSPRSYAHPWDTEALNRMKQVHGFETVIRKFSEWHYERIQAIMSQSTRIAVTARQFPELYELWMICLENAQMSERPPEFYVEMGPLNAYTTGTQKYQVVVSSAMISLLSPRELMFVIGHELGHIRSEHVLYTMFAMWMPHLAAVVGQATLGIGSLLGKGMELAVLDWQRKAELTCDRFGLLVCQDLEASMAVLMKLAGAPPAFFSQLNWEAFADQGREFQEDADVHNKVYQWFLTAHQSHPWPAVRAHHLRTWVEEGHYVRLLNQPRALPAASPAKPSPAVVAAPPSKARPSQPCIRCQGPVFEDDKFCAECGMSAPVKGSMHPIFCLECGCETLRPGDKFCPDCGFPL